MLICLFKLEDVGPSLVNMVSDKNVEFDESVVEKFQFSGSITYSLVFQGMVTIDDFSTELYGPFPFAFSSGFVQYAFSFIAEDKSVKDKRMKSRTLGLVLMLVPEMMSKIDDFREELAKTLLYKFHNIKKISQVNKAFLTGIVKDYNEIMTDLLSTQQADMLANQLINFVQQKSSKKKKLAEIGIIYPKEYIDLIKNYYASFMSSLPYEESSYGADAANIKTKNYSFTFKRDTLVDEKFIASMEALVFIIDVANKDYKEVYSILADLKTKPKIALVVSLPENIEKASTSYAKFFTGLQRHIEGLPFFSASFTSTYDFKSKMLEAIFWTLSPLN
ncbi:MAG: hypothetical protein H7641_05915 [Candidatus Heimdallarchaeota archaeon]|nr:hypothetical protein [Candidatus Heimdallarchaeota archaeon]MCK4877097.1 hypothetical protein [Candidatus Heimdallarchaeota archaeon]